MSWDSSMLERRNGFAEDAGASPRSQHHILAGHQPVYLPGIAVMAKIAAVDQFMWVGHCDYQPRSFHSRNFIWGRSGPLMLSVPVDYLSGPSINEKLINGSRWKGHQLKSIEYAYAKRPYFYDYFPALRAAIMTGPPRLGDFNISLVCLFCEWLNIQTPILLSEDYNIQAHKTAMLAEMCEKVGANHYLSSEGERAYIDLKEMNGYAHSYIKFEHPVYDQGHKTFMPNLSVIDLIFNCGPESGDIVRGAGDNGAT